MIDLDRLPWIDLKDKDAVYQAVDFLPDNPVIMEAGICDAEDTLRFKDIWPDSTIYGFEPNPDLYIIAHKNISNPPPQFSKTKNTTNINISNFALSDKCENRIFNMSKAMPGSSSFFKDNSINVDVPKTVLDSLKIVREEYVPSYKDTQITVKCITIDEYVFQKSIKKVDYLWLDTEGAELMILNGAIKTLETINVVYLEFNFQEFRKGMAQFEDVYNFLIGHNFVCNAIWQAHKNWQSNGVFVRKDLWEKQ